MGGGGERDCSKFEIKSFRIFRTRNARNFNVPNFSHVNGSISNFFLVQIKQPKVRNGQKKTWPKTWPKVKFFQRNTEKTRQTLGRIKMLIMELQLIPWLTFCLKYSGESPSRCKIFSSRSASLLYTSHGTGLPKNDHKNKITNACMQSLFYHAFRLGLRERKDSREGWPRFTHDRNFNKYTLS